MEELRIKLESGLKVREAYFKKGNRHKIRDIELKDHEAQYILELMELREKLGFNSAWPIQDVLQKLIDAANILLHEKNYDGQNYESIEHCVKRAEEMINTLNK